MCVCACVCVCVFVYVCVRACVRACQVDCASAVAWLKTFFCQYFHLPFVSVVVIYSNNAPSL